MIDGDVLILSHEGIFMILVLNWRVVESGHLQACDGRAVVFRSNDQQRVIGGTAVDMIEEDRVGILPRQARKHGELTNLERRQSSRCRTTL